MTQAVRLPRPKSRLLATQVYRAIGMLLTLLMMV